MKYILVKWIHDFNDEPVELYSEIDDTRYEVRKVEIYRDGSFGYADKNTEYNSTKLGLEPVPEFNVIACEEEFIPKTITKEEFNLIWEKCVEDK